MRFKDFNTILKEEDQITSNPVDQLKNILLSNEPGSAPYNFALNLSKKIANIIKSSSAKTTPVKPEKPINSPLEKPEEPALEALGDFNINKENKLPPELYLLYKNIPEVMELINANPEVAKKLNAVNKKYGRKEFTRGKTTQQAITAQSQQDIIELTNEIAKRVGMGGNEFWINTLIGQLTPLTDEEKKIFLLACKGGHALNWGGMLQSEQGMVETYLDNKIKPFWKKISSGIYSMPLAASVGGGQSGNGEAMVAMMVGGQKPEKGDLDVGGKKFEVKATQADIKSTGNVQINEAWLEGDSTKATDVKNALVKWLKENKLDKLITEKLISAADFRPQKINGMNFILSKLTRIQAINLLLSIHSTVFPAIASKRPSVLKYFTSKMLKKGKVPQLDIEDVKKYQGGMAIFEYAMGKHEAKNFLFLSSVKGRSDIGFVITLGAKATVMKAATPGSPVQLSSGITFQGSGIKKASPGIKCFIERTEDGFDMKIKKINQS
jgi:hypothetical protein